MQCRATEEYTMDIRNVLLLTSDYEYVRHVKEYMAQYHDDLRIRHLADPSEMACALVTFPACALIIGMEFADKRFRLPAGLSVAYFSDSSKHVEYGGLPVFCKYRDGEALYRFITGLCGAPLRPPVISAFIGAGGGTGATTLSAAYARYLSMNKKLVLYISLDRYADITTMFDGKCGVFSRLMLAEKADSSIFGDLPLSEVGRDPATATFFIGCSHNASECRFFKQSVFLDSIAALISARNYDAVVLDGAAVDPLYRSFAEKYADALYFVTLGGADAEIKLRRIIDETVCANRMTAGGKESITQRIRVIANRCGSADAIRLPEHTVLTGCIPEYGSGSAKALVAKLSMLELWQQA